MPRIAIFASGSGSNAENIIRFFEGRADFSFPVIVSNRSDAYVHERAKALGVPSFTFAKADFADGTRVLERLRADGVDAVVLAGFLLRVPQAIVDAFPGRIINIHPALLPKFGGKGMYGHHVHEAVKAAGETESGITIHHVNGRYDEGSIIFQARCPVSPLDTPDDIARKVHALEYEHYPRVIERLWGNAPAHGMHG